MSSHYGLPLLTDAVPVSPLAMRLVSKGIASLWQRIVAANPEAENRPLLLSYDVHPSPQGPVLIEINTNAGGILTALEAAKQGVDCCADLQQGALEARLLSLFQRDLLAENSTATGVLAILDDQLQQQGLLPEMQAIAERLRPYAAQVLVLDAAQLRYAHGRLRYNDIAIDRIYWRSTDFLLTDPQHAAIRRAVQEQSTLLAPSSAAYTAIADKRHFIDWSDQTLLAADDATASTFTLAETLPLTARSTDEWHADRKQWVFKPISGYASRGVYVGKSISRKKLESLPAEAYLAQRYAPHPVLDRDGEDWKYDVRFYADRGKIIGAAARVFKGQVVGIGREGSGFAPIRIGTSCCLIGGIATAEDVLRNEELRRWQGLPS